MVLVSPQNSTQEGKYTLYHCQQGPAQEPTMWTAAETTASAEVGMGAFSSVQTAGLWAPT